MLAGGEVAIEVKGSSSIDRSDPRSLAAFVDEHRPRKALLVCNERHPRVHDGIEILPWREFLGRLWSDAILS